MIITKERIEITVDELHQIIALPPDMFVWLFRALEQASGIPYEPLKPKKKGRGV